jgi:hypothetical protein
MMRTKSGIFCALTGAMLFAVACSWGGSGNGDPTPDASTSGGPQCGDGVCAASEVNNCAQDCGNGGNGSGNGSNGVNPVCGNGACENGETSQSCPSDCGGGGSGSGGGGGMCPADPNECIGCILDPTMCPAGRDANGCITCILGGGGGGGACNFNFMCDAGEDVNSCPTDCM